ncbi:MAG: acylphosphatase [Gemmatimonadales bacterium]
MARAHLLITGRVQGVGFRWFVRETAKELQVAGWVKNCTDGNVEIAAEGNQEMLDELCRRVSHGPQGAEVTEVRHLETIDGILDFPFVVRK